MTAAVMQRIPAWQRRLAPIVAALTVVGAISTVSYFPGGPRLVPESGGYELPVTIGEEFHYLVNLAATGGEVTLVRAQAIGPSGPIPTEGPRLLRTTGSRQLETVRGPLFGDYEVLRLAGARIASPRRGKPTMTHVLDFTFRPTTVGAFEVESIEVTYTAGLLRTRTATNLGSLCLRASADWRTDIRGRNGPCAGP
jgi:hypothetical protein